MLRLAWNAFSFAFVTAGCAVAIYLAQAIAQGAAS